MGLSPGVKQQDRPLSASEDPSRTPQESSSPDWALAARLKGVHILAQLKDLLQLRASWTEHATRNQKNLDIASSQQPLPDVNKTQLPRKPPEWESHGPQALLSFVSCCLVSTTSNQCLCSAQ